MENFFYLIEGWYIFFVYGAILFGAIFIVHLMFNIIGKKKPLDAANIALLILTIILLIFVLGIRSLPRQI